MAQTSIACLRKGSAQRLNISGGLALGHATMPLMVVKHPHYCTCRRQYLLTCRGRNLMPDEYAAVRINSMADMAQQAAIGFGA